MRRLGQFRPVRRISGDEIVWLAAIFSELSRHPGRDESIDFERLVAEARRRVDAGHQALSATLTVAAADADDAYGQARRAFAEGAKAAELDFPRVFSVHVDPVGVSAELQPA